MRSVDDDSTFLAAARVVGDRLVDAAVWDRDHCGWTGDEIEHVGGRWQVVHRAVGVDLYNGTSGIARFLGHLSRTSGDPLYRATALAALNRAIDHSLDSPAPGLWSGATGVACVALELADVLNDDGLSVSGLRLAEQAAGTHALASGGPCDLDLISGLAGDLIGFVQITRRSHARYDGLCRAIADRLIAAARTRSVGWSWAMREGGHEQHLCGMAHGASGIAIALAEAYQLLGHADLASAVCQAVDYENCWFDAERFNWPDLRGGDGAAPVWSWQWCHGAAGIGMSRLRVHELTKDPRALADASVALQTVGQSVRPVLSGIPVVSLPRDEWNLSVCHGIGSAIELALYACRVTGAREYLDGARRLAAAGLESVAGELEWRCGVPDGGEHPGLMTGIAGIGMSYLALADPRVPPITMWM